MTSRKFFKKHTCITQDKGLSVKTMLGDATVTCARATRAGNFVRGLAANTKHVAVDHAFQGVSNQSLLNSARVVESGAIVR